VPPLDPSAIPLGIKQEWFVRLLHSQINFFSIYRGAKGTKTIDA
jgi:hypothetical protein